MRTTTTEEKTGTSSTQQRVTKLLKQLKASPAEIRLALKELEAEGKAPRLSVRVRNNVDSVGKHVRGTQLAIRKMLDSGEPIPDSVWKQIESELSKLSVRRYRDNVMGIDYSRPAKSEDDLQKEPKRRGRPVGSKNRPKVEASQMAQTEPKRRGRPVGSKNRSKVEAVAQQQQETKRRGRPVGSKNRPKTEATNVQQAAPAATRGTNNAPTSGRRSTSYRDWKQTQASDSAAAPA